MIWIGTSGWNYPHWKSVFYPADLSSRDWLPFYAQTFSAVEVNYSFYRLPKPETYQKWFAQTPNDFQFSLKASRFLTHVRRLKDVREPLKTFLGNSAALGAKRGPIFFQLPPSFKVDLERLEGFLKLLPRGERFAFEFRHPSWFSAQGGSSPEANAPREHASGGEEWEIYRLLRKYNAALIAADTPRYPYAEVLTADFFYFRLHGHETLYTSSYRDSQLKEYAAKIREWGKFGDGFVFFDNDFSGFAVENARRLKKLLS